MAKLSDLIRKVKHTTCSAVIVAAGSSRRMGEDKLYMDLGGMPVLARTLMAFDECDFVDEIVLVTREDSLERAGELCRRYHIRKAEKIMIGGATRTESVLAGVSAIKRDAGIVLIHDGARPLVTRDVIYDAMHTAAMYQCAAPAIPVTDTVKQAENGVVIATPNRESLSAVQTPQAFVPELLKAALTKAVRDGISYTDDCAAVEALGCRVRLSKGSAENIKITLPVDIPTAEAILRARHG